MQNMGVAGAIFLAALAATFGTALLGRVLARTGGTDEDLAGRRLNRWLIGLSAATTGNSGFIVTGAVGLGYVGGVHWVMLPLAWLLGDLVYWSIFPAKLNRVAAEARATTLSELLTFDLEGRTAKIVSILVAVILITFLATYTSAQWLAGRKFLSGVFHFDDLSALIFFSLTIVAYSALGGFRGSVYTDTFQAIVRIIGTVIAVVAVVLFAMHDGATFWSNISTAGPGFLSPFPQATLLGAVGFVAGYAFAAIGFGLGQPQIVSRYFAGRSPQETKAAMWIYIAFMQSTWIAMTFFGIVLRGVMPGIADPETGFSLFFQHNINAVLTGLIFADVYATIASTSNGLLVAISQAFERDLWRAFRTPNVAHTKRTRFSIVFLMGLGTIGLSMILPGNVFTIALGSVAKIGAGVAGPVLVKALRWRHSAASLLAGIIAGIAAAYLWEYLGYSTFFNEAGVGLIASLLANAALAPRKATMATVVTPETTIS